MVLGITKLPSSSYILHATELDGSCAESSHCVAHESEIKVQNDGWNSSETPIASDQDLYTSKHDYHTEQAGQLLNMKGDDLTTSRMSESEDQSGATIQWGETGRVPTSCVAELQSLEKHLWFHGHITRAEAELRLTNGRNGSFLVRESESTYAISLCYDGRVFHYVITHSPSSKFYVTPESKFETLAQLVAHHSKLSDGLCMVLRHPIPNPRKPPLHSWELDRSDIEMGEELGEGLFGVVYKALLKGNTTVAVKKFTVWHNTCSLVFVTLLDQVETLQDIGIDSIFRRYILSMI